MSRVKQFTLSLASGYLVIATNIAFTLAQWPLAIHYLSKDEFGLWTAVASLAVNLQLLVDLGMSGAVARILIDHKDDKAAGGYGAVLKTSLLALLVQGGLIAVIGAGVSYLLPGWMNIAGQYHHVFQQLMAGHCLLLGLAFAGRIGGFMLQAHQRYDIVNYSLIGGFMLNLLALWFGFERGWGLYSLLLAKAVELGFITLFGLLAAARLQLFPAAGQGGRADWKMFREIFGFANDLFLMSVGQVLIAMSQTPLITAMLGLEANAIWSTMTKTFMLAQQLIARVLDFSSTPFAEMIVRGERDRLRARFRDVVVLTGSLGVVLCFGLALGNAAFVQVWMHGKFAWPVQNDLLMAAFIIVGTGIRCHVGLAGLTKQIGWMRYIYLIEGALFIALGTVLAPPLGFAGVIISGIVSNLLCSGLYGLSRTRHLFEIGYGEILTGWLAPVWKLSLVLSVAGVLVWLGMQRLTAWAQLSVTVLFGLAGLACLWRLGLPETLRAEITTRVRRRLG